MTSIDQGKALSLAASSLPQHNRFLERFSRLAGITQHGLKHYSRKIETSIERIELQGLNLSRRGFHSAIGVMATVASGETISSRPTSTNGTSVAVSGGADCCYGMSSVDCIGTAA